MYFKQFYLESLGHASYLVGDEKTGRALVFDPRRDVSVYFDAARERGLRVCYVMDSHGHNDYISGISELKNDEEVEALGFADAHLGYHHRAVRDGEIVEMGDVAFEVLHTPGHTPEHVSLVIYERATSADIPALMLSGGALLVGDLARPDLLGGPEQAAEMAKVYCRTIQEKLLFGLPDHLEVFPTHVSGSLCGGNIGSRLSTTLGYERLTNAILSRVSTSEEFVEECIRLDNLPAVPPYWRRMRRQNMAGPRLLGQLVEPPALRPDDFEKLQSDGAVVLDARSPEAFGGAHVAGAVNVGLSSSFATWAGTVLPDGARVLLLLDRSDDLWDATWQLLRIGYEVPIGWLAGGMHSWRTAAKPIEAMKQITVHELKRALDDNAMRVLDVRQPAEWEGGRIDGATFVTGAEVPEHADEAPEGPLAVMCGSGYRSSVAASLLAARGRRDVVNVIGGMAAWRAAGYPTVP